MRPGFHTTLLLLWSFTLTSLVAPARAVAGEANVGALMAMPGFRNLVFTIAMVNKAMRDAAENPMDEWRRQNVKIAVGLMPQAIIGLAMVFKSGQLHDEDLPRIQALLGGFVDVSAADNYKKFMVSPDKRLIPKTGQNFPVVSPPPVPAAGPSVAAAGPRGASGAGGATVGPIGKTGADAAPTSPELATLMDAAAKPGSSPAKKGGPRIGFDDSADKTGPADTASRSVSGAAGGALAGASQQVAATGPNQGAPASGQSQGPIPAGDATAGFLTEANRELTSIEAKLAPPAILSVAKKGSDEKKEDDDVFKAMAKQERKTVAKGERAAAPAKATTSGYRLSVKPKYWKLSPLLKLVETAFLDDALAEG